MKMCSIDGCQKPAYRTGWCVKHWGRAKKTGDPLRTPKGVGSGEPAEWIMKHVNYSGGDCLLWPFSKAKTTGRPLAVWFEGKKGNPARIMCSQVNGTPPSETHQAAHSCGKGHLACVHPLHLSWKTSKENHADKIIHQTKFQEANARNTSGFVGVSWDATHGKWIAHMGTKHLGYFDTFAEAKAKRSEAVGTFYALHRREAMQ